MPKREGKRGDEECGGWGEYGMRGDENLKWVLMLMLMDETRMFFIDQT
jgi:hypothetical protein